MKKAKKERLDLILVQRQLCESREKAKRLILAGKVKVDNIDSPKPGHMVATDIGITIATPDRFVSRGGLKLEHALKSFNIDLADRICTDIGASTGGFTDCMCQYGARKVFSVDVGATQLHESIKSRANVVVLDHTNAKSLTSDSFSGEHVSFFGMDVSFISVLKVLPSLAKVFTAGTEGVVLIKPQFEGSRADVSKGKGIISCPLKHKEIVENVLTGMEEIGWHIHSFENSPITGGSGNREFLCHIQKLENTLTKNSWKDRIDIDAVIFLNETTNTSDIVN